MKQNFFILCLFMICGAACSASARAGERVCYRDHCFQIELADTFEERLRGLQGRRSLGHDQGMLFVFETDGTYGFWMKDTLIPLDMIWIDKDQTIVHIEENVPPCQSDPCPSYVPPQSARYVLELNAGVTRELDMQSGERVDIFIR